MAIDIKQTQKELSVLLSALVAYNDNITNPPLRETLSQKEFDFLLSAFVTYNDNIIREIKQTQKEPSVLLSALVTYNDNIANPPLRETLSQKEFAFLLNALVTHNDNIIRFSLMLQQQKGVTTQMTREAVSNNINSPSDFTLSPSNGGNQGLSNKDTKNLNSTFNVRVTRIFTSAFEQVINTVEEDKSVKEEES